MCIIQNYLQVGLLWNDAGARIGDKIPRKPISLCLAKDTMMLKAEVAAIRHRF